MCSTVRLNVRALTLEIDISLSPEGFVVPCDTTGFKEASIFHNQAMTFVRRLIIFLMLVLDLCLKQLIDLKVG